MASHTTMKDIHQENKIEMT